MKVKSLCEVHYPSDDRIERDLPGYPASHGCVGLYDEEMQVEYYAAHDRKVNKQYYHPLDKPYLQGAQRLYEWVVDSERPRDPAPHQ